MRLSPLQIVVMLALATLPGPALAQSIGVASAVNQSALGTEPTAKPRTMVLGDKIIHNEKIETNGKGLLQILLADGTSFTVGPNSSMSIDSFVYDPDANTAKVVATLGKGVFRFIGGRTSKSPDGAVLNTPVGTVGIRGGIGDFDFTGKGKPVHIDMLFGDSIILTDHGTVLGHIFQNGYSIVLGPDHTVSIVKTPPGWTQSFQHDVTSHGSQHGGGPQGAGGTIQTAFKDTTPNTGTPPGGQPPTQFVANTLPPVPFDADTTGDSTWAEINNSSLNGVGAVYTGDVSLQINSNIPFTDTTVVGPDEQTWSGQFSLAYYFGEKNGGGLFSLAGNGGQEEGLTVPVLPLDPNGAGAASFQATEDYDFNGGGPPTEGDPTAHFGVNGTFANTAAGVAHGVNGNITLSVAGVPFAPPGGDIENDGFENTTGTFSGTLDHTVTAPR